jgi:hypothetical protein
MTMATATLDAILTEVKDCITEIIREDFIHGAHDWAYVRVHPDGRVTSGREASPTIPESEYFERGPHPITIWTQRGQRDPATPGDGLFSWTEDPEGEYIGSPGIDEDYSTVADLEPEEFEALRSRGWFRFRLDYEDPNESFEIHEDDLDEIRTKLETWAETNLNPETED